MTKEEILEKAVRKARENGYDALLTEVNCIIFSHDFAKAFWGMDKDAWFESDEDKEKYEQKSEGRGYRYHLQQMVLEENPLNYLEKFI